MAKMSQITIQHHQLKNRSLGINLKTSFSRLCSHYAHKALECVQVVGPCLEAEGAVPHQGYWQEGAA